MNCLYPVLAIVAGVVGVVIGIVTRPTYLGVIFAFILALILKAQKPA